MPYAPCALLCQKKITKSQSFFYVRDSPKSWPGFHVVPFCCWWCGAYMLAEPSSRLWLWLRNAFVNIWDSLRCEIIPRGTTGGVCVCVCACACACVCVRVYFSLNWPRLKSCHPVFRRENCSGPELRSVTGQRAAMRMQAVKSHVTKIWVASKMSYSRNRKMQYHNHHIALKFYWRLGSIATDGLVKFQSDW